MNQPIRIGIVGLGKIARDQHLPKILDNPNFELAFVVDRTVKLDLGVPSYTSLTDALNEELAFEAISICTSPQVRFELWEQLSGLERAILLEKPVAASYALACSIRERAEASNQCCFAAWHSRFASQVATARDWVATHMITDGAIEWRENATKWHPGQDWIWREGGFGVFDPGMNALSILTAIAPAKWSVGSAHLGVPTNVETPKIAEFSLCCGDTEIQSVFEFHDHEADVWTITLRASDGSIMVLADGGEHLTIDGTPVPSVGHHGEYENVYNHFHELISTNKSDCDLTPLKLIDEIFEIASVEALSAIKL